MNPGDIWKFAGRFAGQIYYVLTEPNEDLDLNFLSFSLSISREFLVLETFDKGSWVRIITLEYGEVGWLRPHEPFNFSDFELLQKAPGME